MGGYRPPPAVLSSTTVAWEGSSVARPVKVFSVVGNRPQFIKAAPLSLALRDAGVDEVVLHTGQHWFHVMSQVFFDQLGIAEPRYRLDLHTSDATEMRPAIAAQRSPRGARPRPRLRRHELDARGRARGDRRVRARSRTSRPGCAAVTSRCRRSTTGSNRIASLAPLLPGRPLAWNARGARASSGASTSWAT